MDRIQQQLDDVLRLLERLVDNTSMDIEIIEPNDDIRVLPRPMPTVSSSGEEFEEIDERREEQHPQMSLGPKWRIIAESEHNRDILKFQWFDGFNWLTKHRVIGGFNERE